MGKTTEVTYWILWLSNLRRSREKLGKLVKTDVCTSATLQDRYAHICMEIPLGVPVKKFITIGSHKQQIIYERENIPCATCGVLGHTTQTCPSKLDNSIQIETQKQERINNNKESTDIQATPTQHDKWQILEFPKKRNTQKWQMQSSQYREPGISIKLYHAETGKYLDSQLFRYCWSSHQSGNSFTTKSQKNLLLLIQRSLKSHPYYHA